MTINEIFATLELTAEQAVKSNKTKQMQIAAILYAVNNAILSNQLDELSELTYKFTKETIQQQKEKIERLNSTCKN